MELVPTFTSTEVGVNYTVVSGTTSFPDESDEMLDNGGLTALFNLSSSDLEEIFIDTNLSEIEADPDSSNDVSGWLFALNIVSGFGVLTNSILAFLIIADLIVDRKKRTFTRHWLLLSITLTHMAFLGIEIYMREFGHSFEQSERVCLVLQHTDKTIEFVIITLLLVISIHVIASNILPATGCGKRMVLFWIIFILFVMVCANVAVLALFTMKLENAFPDDTKCQLDPTSALSPGNVHLVAMATFYIPYGIILFLVLSSLVYSFFQQRKLTQSSANDNEFNTSRKYATVFMFITSAIGFLLMLPFYLFQIPEIADVLMYNLQLEFLIVYFVTVLVKLVFYVIFPALCLILKEVRGIYGKLTDS